ncbi:helix-turn-helix domain-containing protein [Novispirillum itersonii]|uniref:helix-turn-helix domain-containing protein n=1 Tax=Novispirillum itersonii TaxID=189 RepID=UPI00036B3550|nr:hypothetical protein [Novispirillum itersonii]
MMDELDICRENMLRAMSAAGLNPNSWAKKAGVSESGVRGFLNGSAPNISLGFLARLAAALGLRAADFLRPDFPGLDPERLTTALTLTRSALADVGVDLPPAAEASLVQLAYAGLVEGKSRADLERGMLLHLGRIGAQSMTG